MQHLEKLFPLDTMRMLHCAPEPFFADRFRARFRTYTSCDLTLPDVDVRLDLRSCPFPDGAFDFVFASHVLEHIPEDQAVMREFRRVLAHPGVAVLPVPVKGSSTREYAEPDPEEHGHVRSPGEDYFDRMRAVFDDVRVLSSNDFPERYQPYVHEDRSDGERRTRSRRGARGIGRHSDFVPVCLVGVGDGFP